MKAQEFNNIIKETIIDISSIDPKYKHFLDYDMEDLDDNNNIMEFLEEYLFRRNSLNSKKGSIQLEKSIGGGEGGGDYVQRVFSITNNTTNEKEYFAIEGYYSSWMGTDYDGSEFCKVKPQEEIVINYVPE